MASQDQPKCWVWQRYPVAGTVPDNPVEVSGRHATIDIGCFGIALPLAQVYRHIKP